MLAHILPFLRGLLLPMPDASHPGSTAMKPLNTLADLDACLNDSASGPVLIFKHSTACPISSEAFRHVAQYAENAAESDPNVYIVKVIEERPVSNQIADALSLQHKSPQLILVKDRAVIWSSSHYGINEQAIREAIASRDRPSDPRQF